MTSKSCNKLFKSNNFHSIWLCLLYCNNSMTNTLYDVIYVIVVLDCNKELGSKMKACFYLGVRGCITRFIIFYTLFCAFCEALGKVRFYPSVCVADENIVNPKWGKNLLSNCIDNKHMYSVLSNGNKKRCSVFFCF